MQKLFDSNDKFDFLFEKGKYINKKTSKFYFAGLNT